MHIQQVKIKNFRCFEDLTVNLNPDVNIFVGNNGSGKSAVLDAIAAAMYPYTNQFKQIVGKESNSLDKPFVFQQDLPIRSDDKTNNKIELTVLTTEFPSWTINYYKKITDDTARLSVSNGDPWFQTIRQGINSYLNVLNNDIESYLFTIAYYRGNRNLTNITDIENISNKSFDRFDILKNAFDATANFTDLANWLFVREFQELREGKKKGDINFELSDLKQVRKAISTIIAPHARVYFSQTTSAKLMVEWENEVGEKIELSLSQLSTGYRNMLALVMDFARRLAQANPEMENPLEAKAVLMIDEIDLHLHPTWQQKIIPDLRKVFPNTQIIATTHSPEIVTTVKRHQVKILEDYQIKECPSPTRGMKSSDVVRYVLGLDNLRPDTEESRTLTALFDAIDNGNLEEAKRLRDKLQDWKSFDPDITRADMQIRRLEREMTA
ncbi:AAA family ATPase [Pseudanabaena yagii]|uniref:AAA family ATPase n=1 Tax=Pseudanabaena yagii GIHE-NHR1 TaxID=2722753 RepID=A0ABX1M0M8_9CYAN|nr:AAA family ATPase [Pseudanabaena yagii]NMF60584.1 AAA family ATPase [Pseudanabaena yagii GIHE-NHR1]